MTQHSSRFALPSSALPTGVSLNVCDFLRADTSTLVNRLHKFVEQISGHQPNSAEVASWRTSIPRLQSLLDDPRLHDLTILLEVAIPRGLGRIDCALLGSTRAGLDSIIVLELKSWSDAKSLPHSSEMLSPVLPNGRVMHDPRIHPSIQALGYRSQLKDLLVTCHDEMHVSISTAAWLYEATFGARAPFNDAIAADVLLSAPVFGKEDIIALREHLFTIAPSAPNSAFLDRLNASEIAPSKSLMERFASSIANFAEFSLTADQLEVFTRVVNAYDPNQRRVIVIKGGPGTGKSVVALHLLKEFHRKGIGALYAARSRAIINYYRHIFSESKSLFTNFKRLGPGKMPVLILDEAHRFTRHHQIKACIESAQLSIFLIDDNQIICPNDIKGYRDIVESAASPSLERLHVMRPKVMELTGEKRCGSEVYAHWIDGLLGATPARYSFNRSAYHFEIVDSPHELESKLRESGENWRIVAGCCWPWSDPSEAGGLVNDVVLPEFDFRRPWSGNPSKIDKRSALYRGALRWATEPDAQYHIGNVYTAQSFEFDRVGVIFGKDLVVRGGGWDVDLDQHSRSDKQFFERGAARGRPSRALACLKNIYRVLLTRGRMGCYVFFQDHETRRYVERLMLES